MTDDLFFEREYNARAANPTFNKQATYVEPSQRLLASLDRIADIQYDSAPQAMLDIYPAGQGSPLFVWIHGGYWQGSSKSDNIFVVPGLVQSGISVASIDYTLAPAASLDEIVRQVRAGISWLYRNAPTYGISNDVIHVGGHSAGGHLTGMLLAPDWRGAHNLPEDIFGVALSISGLFDLTPLIPTSMNKAVRMNLEIAKRNSPLTQLPGPLRAFLLATCGGLESESFHSQTKSYLTAWQNSGHNGRWIPMPDKNHFDIILELEKPGNALFDGLLSEIKRLS